MCDTILAWLKTYDYIAIWLEGIALLAIFIWDRVDGSQEHKQTLAQLKTSHEQVKASQEQVEAMQKPFVMFSRTARDAQDAVMGAGGIVGAMIIQCPGGNAEFENVGSGPAVNVRYNLTPTNLESTVSRPSGYMVAMLAGQRFLTPIPRGILQGNEWNAVLSYESMSGRKYQTKITANNLVLTDVKFEQVPG
jgi:hypothetical protein